MQALASVFAASLGVAMAPVQEAPAPTHFINDRGELMTVDPPSPDRKPIYVSIPADSEHANASAKPGQSGAQPARP